MAPETEVSFAPMDSIDERGNLEPEVRLLSAVRDGYTFFADGDVLLAKITPSFENGKTAVADQLESGVGFGTTELHVLRASNELDRRFFVLCPSKLTFPAHGGSGDVRSSGSKAPA